ncbi:MAG: zinc ABC transporter substrate-binding protein, partial [Phycisphaerales bacterium]|nr:zinc ABC transporter substrate-binding protein [Phycisphaerales bacterium]
MASILKTNLSISKLLIVLVCALGLFGCQKDATKADAQSGQDDTRYRIVTTTGMITDLTQRIAGQRASVTGLMGTGIDPHLYAPTRSDIRKVLGADVLLYSGSLLEGKMTDAFDRVAKSGTTTRAVTEHIDESFLLTPPEFLGHPDPHVWMDP